MKINYNVTENSIEINDDIKNHYLILKIVMTLNLINAIIRLTRLSKIEFGIEEYFWCSIGIISLFVLYFYHFNVSSAEIIKVDEIKQLNEKNIFGNKKFSLELKNGKKRNLRNFKSENEIEELRFFLTKNGI